MIINIIIGAALYYIICKGDRKHITVNDDTFRFVKTFHFQTLSGHVICFGFKSKIT